VCGGEAQTPLSPNMIALPSEAAAAVLPGSRRGWGGVLLLGVRVGTRVLPRRGKLGAGVRAQGREELGGLRAAACAWLLGGGVLSCARCHGAPPSPGAGGGPSPCWGCVVLLGLCDELLLRQVSAVKGFSSGSRFSVSGPLLGACGKGGGGGVCAGWGSAPGPA